MVVVSAAIISARRSIATEYANFNLFARNSWCIVFLLHIIFLQSMNSLNKYKWI